MPRSPRQHRPRHDSTQRATTSTTRTEDTRCLAAPLCSRLSSSCRATRPNGAPCYTDARGGSAAATSPPRSRMYAGASSVVVTAAGPSSVLLGARRHLRTSPGRGGPSRPRRGVVACPGVRPRRGEVAAQWLALCSGRPPLDRRAVRAEASRPAIGSGNVRPERRGPTWPRAATRSGQEPRKEASALMSGRSAHSAAASVGGPPPPPSDRAGSPPYPILKATAPLNHCSQSPAMPRGRTALIPPPCGLPRSGERRALGREPVRGQRRSIRRETRPKAGEFRSRLVAAPAPIEVGSGSTPTRRQPCSAVASKYPPNSPTIPRIRWPDRLRSPCVAPSGYCSAPTSSGGPQPPPDKPECKTILAASAAAPSHFMREVSAPGRADPGRVKSKAT